MRRLVVFGLIAAFQIPAQVSSMASSADGAIFHFLSPRALRDAPAELGRNYIYQHSNQPVPIPTRAEGRTIAAAFVSSDGQTTATLSYSVRMGPSMIATPSGLVQVRCNGIDHDVYGQDFRLSRNGRFVLDTRFANFLPNPNVRDLDTGLTYEIPKVLARHPSHSVANNGAILTSGPGEISGFGDERGSRQVLYTPLGKPSQLLYEGDGIDSAAIDAQASTAFILTSIPPGKLIFRTFYKLIAIDLATRSQTVLYEGFANFVNFTISADGRRLLMQATNQLLLWDRASGWRSLLAHDEDFRESLLTDNGATVFAITKANRYLRIDADSGVLEQLYAPFPNQLRQSSYGLYSGSLVRFQVDYSDLKLHFQIGDIVLPPIKSEPGLFDAQLPWEATGLIGASPVVVVSSEDSPFVLRTQIFVLNRPAPWLFTHPANGNLIAANADFTRLIDEGNPARAGELIHFWVTGLGPLNRTLSTGEKGPADPPAMPLLPMACYLFSLKGNLPPVGLRLPALIYAPNLVALYQVDAELPRAWPTEESEITCKGETTGSSGRIFISAAP